MASRQRGKLSSWKDDRGFGFIKPDDGSQDVFLHISALERLSRRPKVNDMILYERATESNGKVRAAKVSIQGVSPRSLTTKTAGSRYRKRSSDQVKNLLSAVSGIGALVAVLLSVLLSIEADWFHDKLAPFVNANIANSNCTVKGNISMNTGRKLYHLPGMEDYETTVIDSQKRERWFCTESEAIAGGWQKAPH
ncbi:cold shock domain-containing protein [Leptolyngbya sp. BC1307]|uniref:cold shock domain-containing protein n=1 Tax=Leptolyngbya sp. BC1307 TaxID=2029589 RepID=UPI000EFB3081|nr:cold shock domain-containing protein [Leptolyngbya sp. BC1307]